VGEKEKIQTVSLKNTKGIGTGPLQPLLTGSGSGFRKSPTISREQAEVGFPESTSPKIERTLPPSHVYRTKPTIHKFISSRTT